jgi:Na+/H+-dicarboxylate symporter/ABC-type amino acid transport substrate-binding protein
MLRRKSKQSGSVRGSPHRFRASWTVAGLAMGAASGLIFGEYCRPLALIGDAFVGLLQMTVLPYVVVSLLANLGRLTWLQSRRLGLIGGLVLLVLWIIGLSTIYAIAHSFPDWKSGSFFSTAVTDGSTSIDLVKVFVPANVFTSLAENYIPAVVVFCICVGLALTGLEQKQLLIGQMDVLAKALIRVSSFIAGWTPLGVFAIAASTAGTISWDELQRLRVYLIAFSAATLFLLVIVLPWLIAACTPFGYREVWRVSRNALLTAFATGKLIVVLPILIEETERLVAERRNGDPTASTPAIDVLYPLAYPFPHLGKLMGMLFIPFAAWFLGRSMQDQEYPVFLLSGLFSYFGGPVVATPFLLDQMHLPHDMFQLFMLSAVYCGRLGDALGVMHLVTFTLLSISAYNGTLRLSVWRLVTFMLGTCILGLAGLAALRVSLASSLKYVEKKDEIIAHMQLLEKLVPYTVMSVQGPNPEPLRPGEGLLGRIRRRGIIRIGFNEEKLPFAYFNSHGSLVGLDINMAHQLARDMGVAIEFVRYDRDRLADALRNDHFDVVMCGLIGTIERSEQMQHTEPYMNVTMALVAPDHRIRDFASLENIRQLGPLKIGVAEVSNSFADRLRALLPHVELVHLRTDREYFEGAWQDLEGLLISAESGSAFTLLYPDFEVIVPSGARVAAPLFYAVGQRDEAMADYLDHWLDLRKLDGTLQSLYDYWILGKNHADRPPRWSLIRHLGWVP